MVEAGTVVARMIGFDSHPHPNFERSRNDLCNNSILSNLQQNTFNKIPVFAPFMFN